MKEYLSRGTYIFPPGPSARATSRAGLPAGCTPLVQADRLAERLGLGEVWIKVPETYRVTADGEVLIENGRFARL